MTSHSALQPGFWLCGISPKHFHASISPGQKFEKIFVHKPESFQENWPKPPVEEFSGKRKHGILEKPEHVWQPCNNLAFGFGKSPVTVIQQPPAQPD